MKKRIWELDFLRGFAFILMVFDHLTFDLSILQNSSWWVKNPHILTNLCNFSTAYRESDISAIIRIALISGVFILVSGISANLSRNNFKRGLKLGIISILLTLITMLFTYLTGSFVTIYFGILHLLAFAMLISPLLIKIPKIINVFIAIIIIGLGIYFGSLYIDIPKVFMIFNFNLVSSADYYPIFPFLGIYILGIVLGSIIYKNKTTLLPNFNTKFVSPLLFVGRHSLIFYFVHQVLLFILLYLFGLIFII